MNTSQPGKTFVAVVLALVIGIAGTAWVSDRAHVKDAAPVLAQAVETQQPAPVPDQQLQQPAIQPPSNSSGYIDGYRAGYQDAQRDCASARVATTTTSRARRYYSRPTTRVAGVRYYNQPRKDHSTRNMILTIAAPAALGAGIGAIAGGGKGAGAGALIGGGAGALYHLVKNRRQ